MTAWGSGPSERKNSGVVILVSTGSGDEALAIGLVGTRAIGLGGAGGGLGTTLAEGLGFSTCPLAAGAMRSSADGVGSGRPVAGDSRAASFGGFSARTGEEASGSPEGWALPRFTMAEGACVTVGPSLS